MQVGSLRTRITFQQKTVVKDDHGQDVVTWGPLSPSVVRSASFKPLKGREIFEARGVEGEALGSFVVRYDSGTALINSEDHRILENETSMAYAIIAPPLNDRGRNEWLEFWVSSGTQDQ